MSDVADKGAARGGLGNVKRMEKNTLNHPGLAIGMVLFGVFTISINDMLIKQLSSGYPLHQIVFTRSIIGIVFSLILVMGSGGLRMLRTDRAMLHLIRCLMIVMANLTFFTALAVISLAEATALFFVAPLMITLLSIPLLGEQVGPVRIIACVIGFAGVLIMLRPWDGAGGDQNKLILLLPVAAAFGYAMFQILTRRLGGQTSAAVMAVYGQGMFIIVSLVFYSIAGDGRYLNHVESDSMVFLLRPWVWPTGTDIWLFALLGVLSAITAFVMAQAYRLADAATVAPFEYIGLPLAVFWGWLVWGDLPDWVTWIGMALIAGSGLFVFLRERQKKQLSA